MPESEMTTGEIARALSRIESGMADMRREVGERLGQMVPMQVYTLQHQALSEEIVELKAEVAEERKKRSAEVAEVRAEVTAAERQRVTDRRWWMTAVLIPVVSLVLTYVAPLVGGGAT
ncbi:MAG TPA: hypothetical protein VKZ82_28535 [Nonomuraea sp.]|nr:hypothetical protein [Nonomuraea sp.]